MFEGIIIFVIGYFCGMYNDKVKKFISNKIEQILDKDEEENNTQ